MTETLIAQLAREPVPGRVKTRLLPSISAESAARLHADMVRRVCEAACGSGAHRVELWVDGDINHPLFAECRALGVGDIRRQEGEDLGQRMLRIVERGFARSSGKVVLVGSDAPALTPDYFREALLSLDRSEVVIGPALDGGYVLLGLSRPLPELFVDIPWGSDRVLALSLARLDALAIGATLLSALPDIDRPEDLSLLPDDLAARFSG